jgi:hypothetical protein
MSYAEKAVTYIGIAGFLVGVGISWNSLNNRIDRVDEKIADIQKTLGSTTCNAILTRQIEAIEKNKVDAHEALEGLSSQYNCVPERPEPTATGVDLNAAVSMDAVNASADTRDFNEQINAVDVLLHNGS